MTKRPLSMTPNAIASREKRAKARAGKGKPLPGVASLPVNPLAADVGGLQASITPPAAALTSPGLFAKMKNLLKVDASTTKKKEDALENSAIFALLPVTSTFLLNYTQHRWTGYKETMPTRAEFNKTLHPLFRIIARRLEISIELGPDGKDVAMMLSALMAYVLRAQADALEIADREEKAGIVEKAEQYLGTNNTKQHYTSATDWNTRNSQDAGIGDVGSRETALGGTARANAINAASDTREIAETDDQRARRYITEAYRQDRDYRSKNGLL